MIKKFVKSLFQFCGYEVKKSSKETQKNLDIELSSVNSERIVKNFTLIPNSEPIYLPYSYQSFEWYYPECELNSKKWLVDNVKENWNIIDVGANIGYYTILFSKLSPKGAIYSIEPTSTFEMLSKNINYHNIHNAKLYNLAISEKSEFKKDKIYKIWGKEPENIDIVHTSLDDFMITENLNKVDLIKIDTDGYEIDILKGAKRFLEKFNPILMIEFSYALNTRGYEVGELLDHLINLGYKEGLLLDSNNLVVSKKSIDPMEFWSDEIRIKPHQYNIAFNFDEIKKFLENHNLKNFEFKKSKVYFNLEKEEFNIKINELNIKKIDNLEFKKLFLNEKFDILLSELNVISKLRGPRMEINDSKYLKCLYARESNKNHLEFGTWEGYGTALYCRYSSGSVITINLKNGESDMSGESAYPSSYYPETRNKFLGKSEIKISDSNDAIGWIYRINGYGDRVTQIFDNSKNLRLSDFGDKKFETIFIDGGHDEETVVNDTLLALDLLADNGIIIWHDFTMSFEDYISYNSVEGVFKAIHNLTNIFKNKEINLFWIQNSWLLLGRYKKIHINKCYLIC